ncbi:MAG: hypothetical protein PF447_02080, partial [Spirochaetaceae bacterium]|nr:hypothetical protein [Spirochaetaceae bacterium]
SLADESNWPTSIDYIDLTSFGLNLSKLFDKPLFAIENVIELDENLEPVWYRENSDGSFTEVESMTAEEAANSSAKYAIRFSNPTYNGLFVETSDVSQNHALADMIAPPLTFSSFGDSEKPYETVYYADGSFDYFLSGAPAFLAFMTVAPEGSVFDLGGSETYKTTGSFWSGMVSTLDDNLQYIVEINIDTDITYQDDVVYYLRGLDASKVYEINAVSGDYGYLSSDFYVDEETDDYISYRKVYGVTECYALIDVSSGDLIFQVNELESLTLGQTTTVDGLYSSEYYVLTGLDSSELYYPEITGEGDVSFYTSPSFSWGDKINLSSTNDLFQNFSTLYIRGRSSSSSDPLSIVINPIPELAGTGSATLTNNEYYSAYRYLRLSLDSSKIYSLDSGSEYCSYYSPEDIYNPTNEGITHSSGADTIENNSELICRVNLYGAETITITLTEQ